uniref:Cyclin-dependent kinase 2-associated protein n=1 Tax=Glossina morsitans morsitans TaxID=37546 RepID=A0A1B0FJS5_GLOMM
MDIQAVESKLSDVTVTPISRQRADNCNQQPREEQPQIQIFAVNHSSGKTHQARSRSNADEHDAGGANSLPMANNNFNNASANTNAQISVALAAYNNVRQLQVQLALLQQYASNAIALNPSSGQAMGGSMGPYINQNLANPIALQHCHAQSSSPIVVTTQTSGNITTPMTSVANLPSNAAIAVNGRLSKYGQLLAVVEEMGRDIRPASIGSRGSTERLKRSIMHARVLVRECIMEIERSGLD